MRTRLSKALPVTLVVVLLALSAMPVFAMPPGKNLVEKAIEVNSSGPYAGMFDTLIALVANDPAVLATLTGNGQFTVFAPTDSAFDALFAELISAGIDPATLTPEYLTQVLLYHVARGRRDSGDILTSDRIRTLQRGFLFQDTYAAPGTLIDNLGREANIIVPDVEAANGIIHAIDAVVVPYLP
jgi:transforming growth factor-beta-induced protein